MKLLLTPWTSLTYRIPSSNTQFSSITIAPIKPKNIGNEIIKLHSKYNPNTKCISKENSLKEKKLPPLKYKPNLEPIMPENSSKNNKLKTLTKKTFATLLTKPLSSKKYSEGSL